MKSKGGFFVAAFAAVLALSLGLWPTAVGAAGATTSATAVTDDASGVVAGGTFTFTATVTGSAGVATGDVIWTVTDPNSNPVTCSSTTLDGNGQVTCTITGAMAGTYSATVGYQGDTNYATSSGSDSVDVKSASTTTVTDDASGVATGGTFTFTATVAGSVGTPTGNVVWTVTDPNSNPVTCSSTTLDGNGQVTCTITNAIAGTYSATVDYQGDSNYATSSGSDSVTVLASSTTTVTDDASGVQVGGSFTFTATITGSAGTPTGNVSWSVTAPNTNTVSCNSGTTTLDGSGQATCTITSVIAGAYSATAHYQGDSTYATSSGSDPNATVQPATSTTAVTDDASGVQTGGSFTFTAAVTGSVGTPTGSITWTVTAPNTDPVNCSSGDTTTLNGSGQAACTITNVGAGAYSATAQYSGDLNYGASPGSDSNATVSRAAPSSLSISNPPGSGTYGGSFTADVATNGDGTKSVTSNSTSVCTVGGDGLTVTYVGLGTCSLTSHIAQGTNYLAGEGSAQTFSVARATPAPPTISNLPATAIYGNNFTAVLASQGDGAPSVTSTSTNVCTVGPDNLTVTFVGIGTCSLASHVAQGTDYLASNGSGPQTISVGLATPMTPVVINIPSGATEFGGFVASVFTNGDGGTSVASISAAVCTVGSDGHTVSFVGFGVCTLTASVAQGAHFFGATGNTQSFPVGPAARGYWLVGSDGGIFSFGGASFFGSMGSTPLQRPVVGITPSASRTGYWLVASDGGIFSFGSSSYYGSIPAVGLHPAGSGAPNSLNAPIVGMVPSVTGHGYFMVASDGGVFAFGDARFAGSCPGIGGCAGNAVAVMPDSTGNGYWLVTNLGNVYAFGDATFYGAPAASTASVVDAVATQDWRGYWLLYANGVVASFGDATTMGAPLGFVNGFNPATSIFPTADGKGYWIASGRGDVFAYGDAPYLGSVAAAGINGEIIAAFGF